MQAKTKPPNRAQQKSVKTTLPSKTWLKCYQSLHCLMIFSLTNWYVDAHFLKDDLIWQHILCSNLMDSWNGWGSGSIYRILEWRMDSKDLMMRSLWRMVDRIPVGWRWRWKVEIEGFKLWIARMSLLIIVSGWNHEGNKGCVHLDWLYSWAWWRE